MGRFRLVGEGPDDVAVFVALVKRHGLPLAEKGKPVPDRLVIEPAGGDAAVVRNLRDPDDEETRLLDHVRVLLKPRDLTSDDRSASCWTPIIPGRRIRTTDSGGGGTR